MKNLAERRSALEELMAQRVLILDGAMGTMLQQYPLSAADFGGAGREGCPEALVRTRPDVVLAVHRAYLRAGVDILETNSFGGTRIVLAEYDLEQEVHALNFEAARLARQAADEFSTAWKPGFVAGAMGPTTKAISVTGGITFAQLVENYYEQAKALVEGGADLLLLETCQDTRNVKAALIGIDRLERELGVEVPVMVSGTIEATGTMLAGQTVDAFYASIAHRNLLSIGLNCATGPEFMTDHLRTLSQISQFPVSCYPNAGLPDEEGRYGETPESLARQLEQFIDQGWLSLVGGCCGTTDAHIRAIAQMAEGKRSRFQPRASRRAYYSGIDLVEADETNRPVLVGERTNVIGSRLFKQLIAAENWEDATEIARRQMKNGAQVTDVCLQSSERDELQDIPPFYESLIRKIRTPIMIDTTDPKAIELALTYCQGKSIINSINLEDGEEKFERVCPLIRRYGAAVVVGAIDEDRLQAQAFTRERKLQVLERSYRLLTEKYGIPPEDLILDPLVFPCASGVANYIGAAVETREAIRLIKQRLPGAKTVLGISNVSFGLPAAAREVVNSVFLYHCVKAGLDLAIVNAEKLERFASIPERERRFAEDLLFNLPPAEADDEGLRCAPADWREQTPDQRAAINQHHLAAITAHFRQTTSRPKPSAGDGRDLPLDELLAACIVEGTKDGLFPALDRKLADGAPALEIINGPLMAGMNQVGRLFNDCELIVAEVLQSAEVMKAAVTYLEPFLAKNQTASRGKILLATVKGDVHDIGKNLTEMILANNGYEVVNLGIKVAPEALIRAYFEHRPDAIGLSGLLVKSSQQMVATASDLRAAGIQAPLLVGGAALSEKFTREKIAAAYGGPACYAKDGMSGLRLMNQITNPVEREAVLAHWQPALPPSAAIPEAARERASTRRSSQVRTGVPIPPAPYVDRKLDINPDLGAIWKYLNPGMLYGRHLGYRGNFERDACHGDPRALRLRDQIESLQREAAGFLQVHAVWQFFEAERSGNSIQLFSPGGAAPIHTFRFDRQQAHHQRDGLCLSDFILDGSGEVRDHLAMFVVTSGAGVREHAEQWKQSGDLFKSHAIQALALETAEAAAEWLHRRIREDWGFPDPPGLSMQDRFTSKYRGKRYSFGYPACPNLEDQQGIWKLLRPQEIGVELTDGMMMDPEASVSGLIFHHPDCVYFAVPSPC